MKIKLEIIPHDKMRYETVGDYWQDAKGTWQIRISKMSDPRYEQLVFLHELTELTLVLQAGVRNDAIDQWDINYERARENGSKAPCGCCRLRDEPGDDPHCPYHQQHKAATVAEKAAAKAMGVDWKAYNNEVEAL